MTAPVGCRCLNLLLRSATYRTSSYLQCRYISSTQILHTQQGKSDEHEIVIPKKIKRSDTAILDALAETVKQETGPHYLYHDDPYLLPYGASKTMGHALAKASGRKAAQYVIQTYPNLFNLNPTDPMGEYPSGFAISRAPKSSSVTALKQRILQRQPAQAYTVYKKLKRKGKNIPPTVSEQLLALLCFNNGQNPSKPSELVQYFEQSENIRQDCTHRMRIKCTWRDEGEAETVFNDLKNPSPEAYNSLARGRAKHGQVVKARELFKKMREVKIPVTLETFNTIIQFAKDRDETPIAFIKDILRCMKEDGIAPNVNTFNHALYILVSVSEFGGTLRSMEMKKAINMVLNEMKALNIEPSLTTWLCVLLVYYRVRNPGSSNIFREILDQLEGKHLTLTDEMDYQFFSYAMEVCYNMQDIEMAYKLNDVLHFGNNNRLLGRKGHEIKYQSCFLRLLCVFEQIETVMDHYEKTQFMFPANFKVLSDLIKAIELNDGHRYIPQLWSDFIQSEMSTKRDVMEALLAVMSGKQEEQLQGEFVKIADQVRERIETETDERGRLQSFVFTGTMFGHMTEIYLNSDQFNTAWECFRMFKTNRLKIEGYPAEKSFKQLIETCIQDKLSSNVVECLVVMADSGYPTFDVLQARALKELDLTKEERRQIEDLD